MTNTVTSLSNPSVAGAHRHIWLVEKYGRVFARLEDARLADMFWVAYRVVDLTTTGDDRALLFSKAFWHEAPLPSFRHEQTGTVVDTGLAGGTLPSPDMPFVDIRELHPPPVTLALAETIERRGGHLILKRAPGLLWVEAHGYIGPSLLRADLERAARFGREHPAGWSYVVDTGGVRFANPLNVIWLRRIPRLPNLRRYVVVAPSPVTRLLVRLGSWLVRPDAVVRDAGAALAICE